MTDADAVRAHYREALQRRLRGAPEAVQRALLARLTAEAAEPVPSPPAPAIGPRAAPAPSPLAQLNRSIAQLSARHGAARPELRSALAFHDSWAHIRAQDAVAQAVRRGPDNPGPLNSHTLVLRTLRSLSELSPHYLRRFLSHADTLLWLNDASARLKPAAAKTRKARPKA